MEKKIASITRYGIRKTIMPTRYSPYNRHRVFKGQVFEESAESLRLDPTWRSQKTTTYSGGVVNPETYQRKVNHNGEIFTSFTTLDGVSIQVRKTPLINGMIKREICATDCFFLPHNYRSKTGRLPRINAINRKLPDSYDSPGQRSAGAVANLHAIPNSWGVGSSTQETDIGSPGSNYFNQKQREETEKIREVLEKKGISKFYAHAIQTEVPATLAEVTQQVAQYFPEVIEKVPERFAHRVKEMQLNDSPITRINGYKLEVRAVPESPVIASVELSGDPAMGLKNSWINKKFTPLAPGPITLAQKSGNESQSPPTCLNDCFS
ncbi:MAG: hypothetical protein WC860_08510 [Candidatus Margulisiibacteriota bacterium]